MIINKISELRKNKKITEKELSEKIGMSLTGFRQAIEKSDFKVSTLEKISEVLGVPISYWFEDSDKKESNKKEDISCREELAAAHKKIIELQERIIGMQEERKG